MDKIVFDNEKWWQENGDWWRDEVWERRRSQPLYGIQEVFLSSYFGGLPKSKVLEFGVGFGRHIDYLSSFDHLDIYGVDQSPTMLQSLRDNLGDRIDFDNKIKLIKPRQRLPFPDDFFDVTYTVSVLIHVQQEHLHEILSELKRVTKHRIIHLENNDVDEGVMTAPDHNGCWAHSYTKAYKKLGLNVEKLPKAADLQDFYMVECSADKSYSYAANQTMFERLRIIDQRIRPHINKLKERTDLLELEVKNLVSEKDGLLLEREKLTNQNLILLNKDTENVVRIKEYELKLNDQTEELKKERCKKNILFNEKEDLLEDNENLKENVRNYQVTLDEIYSSVGFKVIRKLRNNKILYKTSQPLRKAVKGIYTKKNIENNMVNQDYLSPIFNDIEKNKNRAFVAIHHPDWLGVSNSTRDLFGNTIGIRELYGDDDIQLISEKIINANIGEIIFSGMADGYSRLITKIKQLNPKIKIHSFWHGNTTQMYEDYSWIRFNEIIDLYGKGLIDKLGFAKKSMADLYKEMGYNSYFVMNYIEPQQELWKTIIQNEEIKIGLYSSGNYWNKNAFTQISAAQMIANSKVIMTPCNERMEKYAKKMGVDYEAVSNTISRDKLLNQMSDNTINFYVTFTECAPLLPLESLSRGVPCLTGPNHHYFDGTPLKELLVVNSPDNPIEIAEKAIKAVKMRDEILNYYLLWVTEYNNEAKESIKRFLEE